MEQKLEFETVRLDVVTVAGEVPIDEVEVHVLQKFSCDPPCQ